MTDEEINEAIAEAIGARFFTEDGGASWHFVTKDGCEFGAATEDLNAMHEAENGLTEAKQVSCSQFLHRRLGVLWGFATPRQRAEAFLRTIGKWRSE